MPLKTSFIKGFPEADKKAIFVGLNKVLNE
jgi:hypothetical protein